MFYRTLHRKLHILLEFRIGGANREQKSSCDGREQPERREFERAWDHRRRLTHINHQNPFGGFGLQEHQELRQFA